MSPHLTLRQLGELQHAVVGRSQSIRAGMTARQWRRLVSGTEWEAMSGRVVRLVGHPQTNHQRLMAATLDGGPGTVISRRAAAALWQVPGFAYLPVEISRVRGCASQQQPELGRLYPLRYLPPHLVTVREGIPVLTLPATLYQLAGCERPERMARIVDVIAGRSPGVLQALHNLMPEMGRRGRNGITVMREILPANPIGVRVPTGLERRFEKLIEEAGSTALPSSDRPRR